MERLTTAFTPAGLRRSGSGQSRAIGEQCWFNENLRSAEFNSGYSIPFVLEDSQWQDATFPARCYLNNNEQWFSWFGYLYNWHAISNSGGLCPSGWKVPSDTDWLHLEIELGLSEEEHDILYEFRGQSSQIGTQLKTTFPYAASTSAPLLPARVATA